MKTGQAGINMIKKYEGLPKPIVKDITPKEIVTKDSTDKVKPKVQQVTVYPPYICPAGYPTIGYGSRFYANGKEVTMKDEPITLQECDKLLIATLAQYEKAVEKCVTAPLTQNQFDALVCFTYNLGEQNLKASTLVKYLNVRDYLSAANQFLAWNKSRIRGSMVALPGLTARRTDERNLFLKG